MALQIGNAACALGTVSERCVRRNLIHLVYFFQTVYNCSFLRICFYRSTGMVADMSRLLVFCCYWSTGIVAGMGCPTSVGMPQNRSKKTG